MNAPFNGNSRSPRQGSDPWQPRSTYDMWRAHTQIEQEGSERAEKYHFDNQNDQNRQNEFYSWSPEQSMKMEQVAVPLPTQPSAQSARTPASFPRRHTTDITLNHSQMMADQNVDFSRMNEDPHRWLPTEDGPGNVSIMQMRQRAKQDRGVGWPNGINGLSDIHPNLMNMSEERVEREIQRLAKQNGMMPRSGSAWVDGFRSDFPPQEMMPLDRLHTLPNVSGGRNMMMDSIEGKGEEVDESGGRGEIQQQYHKAIEWQNRQKQRNRQAQKLFRARRKLLSMLQNNQNMTEQELDECITKILGDREAPEEREKLMKCALKAAELQRMEGMQEVSWGSNEQNGRSNKSGKNGKRAVNEDIQNNLEESEYANILYDLQREAAQICLKMCQPSSPESGASSSPKDLQDLQANFSQQLSVTITRIGQSVGEGYQVPSQVQQTLTTCFQLLCKAFRDTLEQGTGDSLTNSKSPAIQKSGTNNETKNSSSQQKADNNVIFTGSGRRVRRKMVLGSDDVSDDTTKVEPK